MKVKAIICKFRRWLEVFAAAGVLSIFQTLTLLLQTVTPKADILWLAVCMGSIDEMGK